MTDRREDIIYGMLEGESDGWTTRYSVEEVKKAMDEYMKECCIELIKFIGNNNVKVWHVDDGRKMYQYNREIISAEQLFENFL